MANKSVIKMAEIIKYELKSKKLMLLEMLKSCESTKGFEVALNCIKVLKMIQPY